ncbi:oligosaccharide flippase family protein [Arthrobacter sp. CAN_A214]|uniref:oligosaccharide flippase family protein n=1 Tax=Arthrobacter sp. CAN_A214 TaxID=2787720 RepID=UPI002FF0C732
MGLAEQFAWTSGGRIISALVQAVTYLLIARDAGPQLFAAVAVAIGLATVLQSIFDLGISTYLVKERALNPDSVYVHAGLLVNRFASGGLLIFSSLLLLGAGVILNPDYISLVPLALWVAGDRFIETRLGLAIADGKAHIASTNLFLRRTISLSIYLLVTFCGVPPLAAVSASFSASTLISLICMPKLKYSVLSGERNQRALIRDVIRLSRPFWFNSVATQVRNIDTLVVSGVGGLTTGGLYGLVARAIGPLRILSTSLSAVLLPAASRAGGSSLSHLRRSVGVLIVSLAVFYSLIVVIVPYVVPAFLGSAYEGAVFPMQIVIGSLIFASVASLLNAVLQATGREWYVAHVSATTSLLTLLLCGLGAVVAGAVGAAIGVAVTFVVQALALLHVYYKKDNKFE